MIRGVPTPTASHGWTSTNATPFASSSASCELRQGSKPQAGQDAVQAPGLRGGPAPGGGGRGPLRPGARLPGAPHLQQGRRRAVAGALLRGVAPLQRAGPARGRRLPAHRPRHPRRRRRRRRAPRPRGGAAPARRALAPPQGRAARRAQALRALRRQVRGGGAQARAGAGAAAAPLAGPGAQELQQHPQPPHGAPRVRRRHRRRRRAQVEGRVRQHAAELRHPRRHQGGPGRRGSPRPHRRRRRRRGRGRRRRRRWQHPGVLLHQRRAEAARGLDHQLAHRRGYQALPPPRDRQGAPHAGAGRADGRQRAGHAQHGARAAEGVQGQAARRGGRRRQPHAGARLQHEAPLRAAAGAVGRHQDPRCHARGHQARRRGHRGHRRRRRQEGSRRVRRQRLRRASQGGRGRAQQASHLPARDERLLVSLANGHLSLLRTRVVCCSSKTPQRRRLRWF
uniref:Uncharacterized protein n=1 Tax=Zea mays TaxID=4577 RepID=A0A804R7F1_MAIZE